MNFSSMLIAFVLSACSRRRLVWWSHRMGRTVGGHVRCEHVWFFVCSMRKLVRPTESPAANQTGWTETGPPLPLSRAAYRTVPRRWTSPRSATPSETSDEPPSGTETRHTSKESTKKHMVINFRALLSNGDMDGMCKGNSFNKGPEKSKPTGS